MKKRTLFGIGVVAFIAVCVCIFFVSEAGSTYYYSQIDNSKIEPGKPRDGVIDFSGGMDYSYTLFSYNENGKGKDITFGTSRELKEGAFICLTVMPIRGVLAWEEVQYDELPKAVKEQYPNLPKKPHPTDT